MSKEDLILRETSNPPLITKNSELTFADLDSNFITLYNQLVLLSQSSQIAAYSNAIQYSINQYVSLSSQTWKMINPVPQTDITPGTDPSTWIAVYPTDMIQAPVINASNQLTKEVLITSAQILALNGTDSLIELIANPGSGKFINPIHAIFTIDFNTTIYEGFTGLGFGFTNDLLLGDDPIAGLEGVLTCSVDYIGRFKNINIPFNPAKPQIKTNDSLSLTSLNGAPIFGDSDIKIFISYQILDF